MAHSSTSTRTRNALRTPMSADLPWPLPCTRNAKCVADTDVSWPRESWLVPSPLIGRLATTPSLATPAPLASCHAPTWLVVTTPSRQGHPMLHNFELYSRKELQNMCSVFFLTNGSKQGHEYDSWHMVLWIFPQLVSYIYNCRKLHISCEAQLSLWAIACWPNDIAIDTWYTDYCWSHNFQTNLVMKSKNHSIVILWLTWDGEYGQIFLSLST